MGPEQGLFSLEIDNDPEGPFVFGYRIDQTLYRGHLVRLKNLLERYFEGSTGTSGFGLHFSYQDVPPGKNIKIAESGKDDDDDKGKKYSQFCSYFQFITSTMGEIPLSDFQRLS